MSSTFVTATSNGDHVGADPAARAAWFEERFRALHTNVGTFIKGMSDKTRMALVCLMAEGHLLIEDVPGVGKTSLAKAIVNSIGVTMRRVQCTPDLLASDIVGVDVYHPGRGEFEFKPGPAFANLLFADELNRASPKMQSALLEVMEERHITVGGSTYPVEAPFTVIATQNTSDSAGTYPLMESQLERFLMCIDLGQPDLESEVAMLENHSSGRSVDEVRPVIDARDALTMTHIAKETRASTKLLGYIARVRRATGDSGLLKEPVSPRGGVALLRAAKSHAASYGREYVTADDVKRIAPLVLEHRMFLTPEALLANRTPAKILDEVLDNVSLERD